jgi:hypothetical protein
VKVAGMQGTQDSAVKFRIRVKESGFHGTPAGASEQLKYPDICTGFYFPVKSHFSLHNFRAKRYLPFKSSAQKNDKFRTLSPEYRKT